MMCNHAGLRGIDPGATGGAGGEDTQCDTTCSSVIIITAAAEALLANPPQLYLALLWVDEWRGGEGAVKASETRTLALPPPPLRSGRCESRARISVPPHQSHLRDLRGTTITRDSSLPPPLHHLANSPPSRHGLPEDPRNPRPHRPLLVKQPPTHQPRQNPTKQPLLSSTYTASSWSLLWTPLVSTKTHQFSPSPTQRTMDPLDPTGTY